MWKKTKYGYVEFKENYKNEDLLNSYDGKQSLTLNDIEAKLDGLLVQKARLSEFKGEEFENEFDNFLDSQYTLVESLSPILDRLAELGTFLMFYQGDVPNSEEGGFINFWSETGFAIRRGYAIHSSKVDLTSEHLPTLESEMMMREKQDEQ